ncbi:hypothetical protein C2S53_013128 [Perilla frutescens var. hirtella]|uniref:TPX2 central domain-containing protein n=1 Tax=Perilla frutescens var. hirtella TaxID=608512 RepID=A0AAD4J730_PERFH|nr:hypothetical protein C2S53_013128 [Perilla frutescens var. hirtella]
MEDFVEDCYDEIDEEYEFDASQFFDFTTPELDSQIEEVERWFQFSGDYPHSPFIVKLDLDKILPAEASPRSSKSSKIRRSTKSMSSSSDTDSKHGLVLPSKKNAQGKGHLIPKDSAKPNKTKPDHKLPQPKSSNFMEPTASHLAKQNNVHHNKQNSSHLCTRFQRTQTNLDRKTSSIISTGSDNLATKRQKIESGFLKKVTIPREPELETLLRSQRRRSKNSTASSESETPKQKNSFKAHNPSNRKEFNFKTTERANHHSSAKENRSSTGESLLESPLTEEFNKDSSRSTSGSRGSSHQAEIWRPNQHCGGRVRVHEANMTSSQNPRSPSTTTASHFLQSSPLPSIPTVVSFVQSLSFCLIVSSPPPLLLSPSCFRFVGVGSATIIEVVWCTIGGG